MNRRLLLSALLMLSAAGCSFTPSQGGQDAQFNPPILGERKWATDHTTLPNGTKVCSISSGYNGITVFLSNQDGQKTVAVKSTRMMQPGATFTVSAGGGNVESYSTFFSPDASQRLVENLAKGGTAYLEWSEFSGSSARERVNIQNIVPLDGFASDLKSCRLAIGS